MEVECGVDCKVLNSLRVIVFTARQHSLLCRALY